MCIAHLSLSGGSPPKTETPRQRPPDRDPLDRDPQTETHTTPTSWKEHETKTRDPQKEHGTSQQRGSHIIQIPPVDRRTPVKTLPCPKLRLGVVNIGKLLS